MTITWWGQTCFKIENNNASLVINPPPKSSGLKRPRGEADVVLFSEEVPPKNDWKGLVGEKTLTIESPGEYDVKGFFVFGLASNGSTKPNVFVIRHARNTICHIANYQHDSLTDADLEKLGAINILMVSVGGTKKSPGVFSAQEAAKITNQIEPNIVIPMNYKVPGIGEKLESPKPFLKELGASDKEAQKKLTLRKNESLSGEETEVVVLNLS